MLLEIVQARKTFGEIPALEGVDLRLQPREKLALLGPNGAGKTTLVLRKKNHRPSSGCFPPG